MWPYRPHTVSKTEREREKRERRERERERQDPALHKPKWAGARLSGVSLINPFSNGRFQTCACHYAPGGTQGT